jgi:hypothetical protein
MDEMTSTKRLAVHSEIAAAGPSCRLVIVLLAILVGGCATGGGSGYQAGEQAAAGPPSVAAVTAAQTGNQPRGGPNDVTGLWQGQSVANCQGINPFSMNTRCHAINDIDLTLIQEGKKITGFYKCSVGNMDCRNQNDSGTVGAGEMRDKNRVSLRIAMPDGSSCIFNGAMISPNKLSGSYSCYEGGGLAEQGAFGVSRNY